MNKLILATVMSGLAVSDSLNIQAENAFHYDYATVLQSKPIIQWVERTSYRQECQPRVIRKQSRHSKSGDKLVGSILGAAVGHALGSRSKHRTGATIAGALIGSSIAANANSRNQVSEHVENHCTTIPSRWQEEQIVGYQVVYRYNGRTFESRLPYDPGQSMKIRVQLSPISAEEDREFGDISRRHDNYDRAYDNTEDGNY